MKEALQLYRQSLKMLKVLPASHSTVFKNKMAYNFREIFEIHRREKDPERIQKLFQDYRNDIQTLHDLFSQGPDLVNKLFPIFDLTSPRGQSSQPAL